LSGRLNTQSEPPGGEGSEKAAAHRLGLSHSTVKHHLANARSKVGAETTAQLVWILGERLPEPEATSRSSKDASGRFTAVQRAVRPHELFPGDQGRGPQSGE
jgi:hypothetical protein